MKVSFALFSQAFFLAGSTLVDARGRGGGNGSKGGKGKSAVVEEEESTCECDGVITLERGLTDLTSPSAAAAAVVPEGCVWIAPTVEQLQAVPSGGNQIFVPVFKDPALVLEQATTGASQAVKRTGWFYADGTPVPATAWAAAEPAAGVTPSQPVAMMGGGGNLFDAGTGFLDANAPFAVYYQCCQATPGTCANLVEPETEAPTPAPTKGKSRRRLA